MVRPLIAGLLLSLFLPAKISPLRETLSRKRTSPGQNLQKCEDAKVKYSAFDAAYSKRITFSSVTDSENPPETAHKEYSRNQNMWKVEVDPDTTKPGPWNKSIFFGSDSNEEVWKLTFIDEIGAGTQWLNEKLVYGDVFWGRIYATEFVLDVQQHKFIYREMASYGAMTEPCQ